jgi:predicted ATPase
LQVLLVSGEPGIGKTRLLDEIASRDAESVQEQLREAVQAGLLHAGSEESFSFGHDKIRACLYEKVIPLRRRRLHGFIGRGLEARREPPDAHRLAELAYHFVRSGDRDRGVRYAQRAAQQAMTAFAPDDAFGHHADALDLLEPHDTRRGQLLMDLGAAAGLAGQEPEASEAHGSGSAQRRCHATWLGFTGFGAKATPAGFSQVSRQIRPG